ncbi:hypothetical protein ACWDKQ_09900 [Saccharopolyspora sp. NPDC000995]
MSVEVECRARFDWARHESLMAFLLANAENLGENNKHIHFYVLPDALLKVVHNLSSGTAKVSFKSNKIGQGAFFPEYEYAVDPAELETVVKTFNLLGFADARHDAHNERHDFRYKGVEIAVKYSEAWGYHAEFELVLPDGADRDAQRAALERIDTLASELGVQVMTEEELAAFTAEFEQKQAQNN